MKYLLCALFAVLVALATAGNVVINGDCQNCKVPNRTVVSGGNVYRGDPRLGTVYINGQHSNPYAWNDNTDWRAPHWVPEGNVITTPMERTLVVDGKMFLRQPGHRTVFINRQNSKTDTRPSPTNGNMDATASNREGGVGLIDPRLGNSNGNGNVRVPNILAAAGEPEHNTIFHNRQNMNPIDKQGPTVPAGTNGVNRTLLVGNTLLHRQPGRRSIYRASQHLNKSKMLFTIEN